MLSPLFALPLNSGAYVCITTALPYIRPVSPTNFRWLVQKADGHVMMMIAGESIYWGGQATGAFPKQY